MNTTNVNVSGMRRRINDQRILIRSYQKALLIMALITIVAISGAITFVAKTSNKVSEYNTLEANYEELKVQYASLYEEYSNMYDEYKENIATAASYEQIISGMNEMIYTLDQENKSLASSNQQYFETIQLYEEREELFDKYEYAITRTDGTRTDLTYEQLSNVEELAEEQGVDVDLVLSIVMTESNGVEDAKSSRSTAKGYGQILDGTGEFIWENLLDNGTYKSSYALNGDYNLQMTTAYLGYLGDYWDQDIYMVIKNYRGEDGEILKNYMSKIDSYLETKNKTLDQLAFKSK